MQTDEKSQVEFFGFLHTVADKAEVFFGNADLRQIAAYIEGYQFCLYHQTGCFSQFHEEFNTFVHKRLAAENLPGGNKLHWVGVMEQYCQKSGESELSCFRSLLRAYLAQRPVPTPGEHGVAHWIGLQSQQADPLSETFFYNSAPLPSKLYRAELQKENACFFRSGALTGFYFTRKYLSANGLSAEDIRNPLQTVPIPIPNRPIWIELTDQWYALRFPGGFEAADPCYAYLLLIMNMPADYCIFVGEETIHASDVLRFL